MRIYYIVIFLLLTFPVIGKESNNFYYLRLDIKTVSGQVTQSNLLVIPSCEEYRHEKFNTIRVKGIAKDSEKNKDVELTAKQHGFCDLLEKYGLKSVDYKASSINSAQHDEIVVSYEGVVKYPLNIIKKGYDNPSKVYMIDMEVKFSPIAYPDKWSVLYFKKKAKDKLYNILSIFK